MLTGAEILSTAQMRAIESAAMTAGDATGLTLMERAGSAVARQIRQRWPRPGRATVLCGPGNNGGDGYVIAQHLHGAGWQMTVLGIDTTPGPDAARMKALWQRRGAILPLTADHLPPQDDLYIDAIFGTGLTRPADGAIGDVLGALASSCPPGLIVAVDCPSGLCMDSGAVLGAPRHQHGRLAPAVLTVAFDSPKPGHLIGSGPVLCGELEIADIGISRKRAELPGPHCRALWPPIGAARQANDLARALAKTSTGGSHKFTHGHALIVAGGAGRGGAARLSARAALRSGAGLVTLCPAPEAMPEHAGQPDALMRSAIDRAEDLDRLLEDRRITALCIGPGCGVGRAATLLPAVLDSRRPCVLDADALTALAGSDALRHRLHEGCVMTPHSGEFARLFPDLADLLAAPPEAGPAYSKLDAARQAAARSGTIVLLKGPDTVIAAPSGDALIHSANDIPWLATAGAGDVLAGIIAGLLARGLPPLDAAGLSVLLHAAAARRFGPGLIADDLPETLPRILREEA